MTDVTLPDGRVMPEDEYKRRLELLATPFTQDQIEKLPKQLRRDDRDKYACRQGTQASADGHFCGGYHARSMHLDYVGHATITDRLNEVDPLWSWEPMAYTDAGEPLISGHGMWGKLTVLGVTRIGFGDAGGKNPGPNAIKEIIGDFLRNASMRFGVATYLWSKSEAALEKKRAEEPEPERKPAPAVESTAAPANNGPDWNTLFANARGNREQLQALRNQGKQAGLPEDFGMFTAIETELTNLPIEGTVQP